MRSLLTLLVVLCGVLAAVLAFALRGGSVEPVVLPQSPMPGRLLVGFQDDATFRWAADRTQMLDRARDAGISVIRTMVVWRHTAPTRPADAVDPFDPRTGWTTWTISCGARNSGASRF